MAWTAPYTWTTDELVAAARMNASLRDEQRETAPAKAEATGDLFVGIGTNQIARVAVGADDTVFRADSSETSGVRWGTVDYSDLTGTDPVQDLVTTKGDLLVATSADTLARLAVGADGEIYIADASETTGLRTGTVASSVTYDALNTNEDVGTGADQVAGGDHGHDLNGSLGLQTTQTASGNPSLLSVTRSVVLTTAGIIGVHAYHVGENDFNSSPLITISAPNGVTQIGFSASGHRALSPNPPKEGVGLAS